MIKNNTDIPVMRYRYFTARSTINKATVRFIPLKSDSFPWNNEGLAYVKRTDINHDD